MVPISQISFAFDEPTPPKEVKEAPAVAAEIPLPAKDAAEEKPSRRGRRSIRDMERAVDLIQIPEDEILFQKQYYSIGEVAVMFREKNSLIRYWEKEFSILKPRKNKKGDRFFRPEDIKNLKMIYHLLRERKYTIEGAKDFIKAHKRAQEKHELIESLQRIKSFLVELKNNL